MEENSSKKYYTVKLVLSMGASFSKNGVQPSFGATFNAGSIQVAYAFKPDSWSGDSHLISLEYR